MIQSGYGAKLNDDNQTYDQFAINFLCVVISVECIL